MKNLVSLFSVLLLHGCTAPEPTKCSSKPVELLIIMEGTSTMDMDKGDQMDQIAKNISLSVPNGSTIFVSSLGDGVEELLSFNKTSLDLSWIEKWPNRNEVKQFGDTLSARVLDNELIKRFSANQYKLRSEIVILLVSDTSKLDTVPSLLTKKKTFVVVFGSSVPSIFNSIASRPDHLFLVSNNDELESAVVRILEQIACENQAADDHPVCLPFRALIIWHIDSENGNSFYQQERLIERKILGFPEGTDISLVTFGAKMTGKLHFIKKISKRSLINKLAQHEPGKSEKHDISYLELSNAVYNHFDKDENPKMAEAIFLIVSNRSRIDEQLKVNEVLKKKKTFVIISGGKHTSGDVLTNLATDNRHVIGLGGSTDSINDAAKSILNLSCQDAKLVCDTDKYWTGNRCYRCTYACSTEALKPSQYCKDVCPYYKHTLSEKDRKVDHSTLQDKGRDFEHSFNDYSLIAARYSSVNTILLSLTVFVSVNLLCCNCTSLKARIRKSCTKRNTPERRRSSSNKDTIPFALDNAHEVEGNDGEDDRLLADGDYTRRKDQIEQNERNESINNDRVRPNETYNGPLPDLILFETVATRPYDMI